jgi:hypothetical protein
MERKELADLRAQVNNGCARKLVEISDEFFVARAKFLLFST